MNPDYIGCKLRSVNSPNPHHVFIVSKTPSSIWETHAAYSVFIGRGGIKTCLQCWVNEWGSTLSLTCGNPLLLFGLIAPISNYKYSVPSPSSSSSSSMKMFTARVHPHLDMGPPFYMAIRATFDTFSSMPIQGVGYSRVSRVEGSGASHYTTQNTFGKEYTSTIGNNPANCVLS